MRFSVRNTWIGIVISSGILAACTPVERNAIPQPTPTVTRVPIEYEAIKRPPAIIIEKATPSPWVLVWQDEFNTNQLDKDSWTADVNDWGGGNQELQYYTNRSENVYLENGLLNIVGRKEPYRTRDYTSARLTSTRSWTYGRFEIKAALPQGQGIWPAIWLRSASQPYGPWAASGEIDIMEMLGKEPNIIYGTLHYGASPPQNESKQESTILPSQGFHIYSLEWETNEIRWYVDDFNYLTIDSWNTSGGDYPAPFDKPFNIVLNLAVGGEWPGNPDETTVFPQNLLIDYVRVYQK